MADPEIQDVEADLANLFTDKKKKKSKKSKKDTIEDVEESGPVLDGTGKEWTAGPRYQYADLLNRVQTMIQSMNPDLGSRKILAVKPPTAQRVSSKKSAWTNFLDVCKSLDRSSDHVLQFVLSELGTEGSLSGENHLVFKGHFDAKHFEAVLKKYIKDYVTCPVCRSPKTKIERDNDTRLSFIKCNACGAHRSVSSIKGGFHATTRADRKKAKAAA